MTGRSHLAIGASFVATSLLLFFENAGLQALAGPFFLGLFASVLPDIDAEDSILQAKIGQYGKTPFARAAFPRTPKDIVGQVMFAILSITELLLRTIPMVIFSILRELVPHRGLTHYFLTAVTLSGLISLSGFIFKFSQVYACAFLIGYVSHILADATTPSGVKMLAPFYDNKVHLLPKNLRIKTGSQLETVVVSIVGLTTLGLLMVLVR